MKRIRNIMTNIRSLMLYMLTLVVTRMEYRAESDLESWCRVMQVIMAVHLRFQLFHYHQN